MPVEFHYYYACSVPFARDSPYDYYIGGFVGNHFNDPLFAAKLKRIEKLLNEKYGISKYCKYWSPLEVKPYKPRTPEQRYQTAMKKAANKHQKKVDAINYDFNIPPIGQRDRGPYRPGDRSQMVCRWL